MFTEKRIREILVFFLLIITLDGIAEGTKQLLPDSTVSGAGLYIDNTITSVYTKFALINCPQNYRLNIHIRKPGEKILFGFSIPSIGQSYNLRKPNGTIAMSGYLSQIPGTAGTIVYYHQAITGPFPQAGGYIPFEYTVSNAADTGDYYFEFSRTNSFTEIIDYWDFQVVSGMNNPAVPSDAVNGRVWSKSWQVYAFLAYPVQYFNGEFCIYSDDGIVTKLAFSNAHIGAATIFCNPYGCLNTGNFNSDRQSKNTNTFTNYPGIAQYKVFLNDPDPLVYPSGVIGEIIPTPYVIPDTNYPPCSGRKNIVVNTNKAGKLEIGISFPYGAPATNVYLYANVVAGVNYIPWDGKDGQGNMAPDGTAIVFNLKLLNGLTNLPIWDQEQNPHGYIISLIRPVNPGVLTPFTFWDDTQLLPGTYLGGYCNNPPQSSNLSGCTPGSIPGYAGCHPWAPYGPDCHNKMINTWWYSSTATTNFTAVFTQTPPNPAGHGDSRCGAGVLILHATVLPTETVDWYASPAGGTPLLAGDTTFITPVISGTTTYYAEARSILSGCLSSARIPVVATVLPMPQPTVTGPSIVCTGSTGNVYTTEAGMNAYSWTISSGGMITTGPGTNAITVTWLVPGIQIVTVTYTNAAGCEAAMPATYTVIVTPPPVPGLNGPDVVCLNTNHIYRTQPGMLNYSWTVSPGGMIASGGTSTSDTIGITWTIAGMNSVSVGYSSPAGCPSITPGQIGVNVNPPPVPSITGPSVICLNDTGVYLTQPGMTGYGWSISPGGTIINGGTSLASSVTILWTATGSQTVSVNYTSASGCTGTAPALLDVMVNPLPVPAITGPSAVCVNSSVIYSTQPGMTGYFWTVSAGGSIVGGSGTNTITVNWTAAGTQAVTVTFTDMNGCNPEDPVIVPVDVYPLPVAIINGPTPVCLNSAGNTYVTEPGMSNYTWTVSPGGMITSGGTTVDESVTVTWSATAAQSVQVEYDDAFGCHTAVPAVYPVVVNPLPVPVLTGPDSLCEGAAGVLYLTQPGMTDYNWSISPGGVITSGSATDSITVSWQMTGMQFVTVTYRSAEGCDALIRDTLNVEIHLKPGSAGPITGSDLVCAPDTGIVYSIREVPAAKTYYWIIPPGVSITSGAGTNSITVAYADSASSGEFTVFARNDCGDGLLSPPFPVIVNHPPSASAGPDASTCTGVSWSISQASASGYSSILWTASGNGSLAGEQTLTPVYTPSTSDTGTITITLTATGNPPCGNAFSMMHLRIIPQAVINAGPDKTTCEASPVMIDHSSGANYSNVLWNTCGDGSFNDPTLLHPEYFPGEEDIQKGQVALILTGYSEAPCVQVSDTLMLGIAVQSAAFAGADAAICHGEEYILADAVSTGTSFLWKTSGDGIFDDPSRIHPRYSPGPADLVRGYAFLSLSAGSASPCLPVSDTMRLNLPPAPVTDAGKDHTVAEATSDTLKGNASGGSGDYTWQWEPPELLTDPERPDAITIPLVNETVFVLTVTDRQTGCSSSDSVTVLIGHSTPPPDEGCIIVHNVITPNGDGLNDTWIIDCITAYPDNTVDIFNRWGDPVNRFSRYDNTSVVWKGTNFKGEIMPDGTYFYVLKIRDVMTKSGWIYLR